MGNGVDDRRTPLPLFEQYNRMWGFTLDAAASHENKLVRTYCTLDGTFIDDRPAPEKLSDSDGLAYSWTGQRVWINPPYGRGLLAPFIKKAYSEVRFGSCEVVVALLPVRTEQAWFHDYVLNKAQIEFLRGRVKYDGLSTGAPFPSMVVTWLPG